MVVARLVVMFVREEHIVVLAWMQMMPSVRNARRMMNLIIFDQLVFMILEKIFERLNEI